jgi:hypothetical protein
MDEVANYKLACTAAEAMVTDYQAGYPPFLDAPASIPLVPCDAGGDPIVADPPFEYIELRLPDGANRLAVLTPYEVSNGPGPKYHVTKVG